MPCAITHPAGASLPRPTLRYRPTVDRHIVAMGGFSGFEDTIVAYLRSLVRGDRPRICLLPTASGDPAGGIAGFFLAFAAAFEPTVLQLFDRQVSDLEGALAEQDLVLVPGGNTANMLAIWRLHGVDVALRAAWEAGVVLAGWSAGGACWFEACTTDSWHRGNADPLGDLLGFVPGSFCPHYDVEPERRPRYREHVAAGRLPGGIACDDAAAVHLVGTEVHEAVAWREGARAWRVTRSHDAALEQELPTRSLPVER
jgi:dipeptidase E